MSAEAKEVKPVYNNDYESLMRNYLRQLGQMEGYCETLKARIVSIEVRIRLAAAPKTTHFEYSGGGSGGWNKPSEEEAAAIRKEDNEALLLKLRSEYFKYKVVVDCIHKCVEALPGIEREIIKHRDIDGEKWEAVALRCNVSKSSCTLYHRRAIKKLTGMYFGPKAYPEQGSLFLKGGNVYMPLDSPGNLGD